MKNPARVLLNAARILLGIVLFWLVASKTGGLSLALPALSSPALLLPVLLFSVIGAILETLRFTILLRSQDLPVSFGQAFRLVTAAFSFNFCIPGGATGDLSRIFYLRSAHSGKAWELATVVFVDRLIGLFSLLVLIFILGASSWPLVQRTPVLLSLFWVAAAAMVAILVFAALCLSSAPSPRSVVARMLRFMPFRTHLERVAAALFQFSNHRMALGRSLLVSFAGAVTGAAVFTVLGFALFAQSPFPVPVLLSMLGMFANTITVTPGGLGIGEAAFDVLFAQAGLAGGAAMLIIWRVGMVPLCLLGIGFYMYGLETKAKRRTVHSDNGVIR
jgi:uncharacterized protein (TIRG00374 family)